MSEEAHRMVLYHSGCRDGFGAAWAAYCYFGNAAEYAPISHFRPLPDLRSDAEVWFLDFCPRAQVLVELLDAGHEVYILDHHRTAKEVIESVQSSRLHVVLDMDHSGAVIAWKHFFPRRKVPYLLQLIEDRDIWKWELDETEAITEALDAMEWSFELFDRLHKRASELSELAKAGHLLVRYKHKQVENIVKRAYYDEVGGYDVPVVNTDSYVSNVARKLCEKYPEAEFGATWFQLEDGRIKWSLRSIGDFDVSEVAKQYGGGGHRNAAGFVR